MRFLLPILVIALLTAGCSGSAEDQTDDRTSAAVETAEDAADLEAVAGTGGAETGLEIWLDQTLETYKSLEVASSYAWYRSAIDGTDENFAASRDADDALNRFLSDPAVFARVVAERDAEGIDDPVLRRRLDVLYLEMLGKQVPPDLLERTTALEKDVEQVFNAYRGEVAGRARTRNEIEEILRTATDSEVLQEAWEAQKAVGPLVAPKLIELVKLRNETARALGYRDFYAMRIAESELDEDELLELFDELDRLTREPFRRAKAEVDRRLAARLGLPVEDLMPWHYQNPFFQEPPAVFETGLDEIYREQDILELCTSFFDGIGLPVDAILARSDLYEKEGKTPHAWTADLDREGDIRVIANIVPGLYWQMTMLHELGHAVYDAGINPDLPFILRKASHPLTTEGTAMLFERLAQNPAWAHAMGIMSAEAAEAAAPEARAYRAFSSLLFSRWTQVMLRFERELYRDPDQDLATLWWDLVERYQELRRPAGRHEPDYASKTHLVVAPVYYHNYMLGELFAAQVHETLAALEGVEPDEAVYVGDPQVGEFLKKMVFFSGKLDRWDEVTRRATGADLGPEAFARRFQGD